MHPARASPAQEEFGFADAREGLDTQEERRQSFAWLSPDDDTSCDHLDVGSPAPDPAFASSNSEGHPHMRLKRGCAGRIADGCVKGHRVVLEDDGTAQPRRKPIQQVP